MGGAKAHYDGIVAFSQTDFTEDLKKITVPVLVMHSEDDQIVPYADAGPLSAKLLKNGTLKTYKASRTACRPRRRTRLTPTCWLPEGWSLRDSAKQRLGSAKLCIGSLRVGRGYRIGWRTPSLISLS